MHSRTHKFHIEEKKTVYSARQKKMGGGSNKYNSSRDRAKKNKKTIHSQIVRENPLLQGKKGGGDK